ncbi:MAG: hypothetical protein ACRC6M_14865 [Microcystaceae cyanobacterium]
MSYEYLRQRVTDSGWVGKEILTITDEVRAIVDTPRDWLFSLSPMKAIADSPTLAWIIDAIDAIEDLPATCALLFMESAHGINRAYNSEKYDGQLEGRGNDLLGSLIIKPTDEGIYLSAHKGYTTLRNYSGDFEKIAGAIEGYNPQVVVEGFVETAIAKVENLVSELADEVQDDIKEFAMKAKRKVRDLQRIFKGMQEGVVENLNRWRKSLGDVLTPKFVGELVPIVTGIPTLIGSTQVLQQITTWLLTNFFQFMPISVPVEAMAWCVNSIVIKYLGGVGANACRFLSAGLLRGVEALPSLIAPSGMFAGCWGLLMSFAPYLILGAILVIAMMKFNTTLGEYLYVLGIEGDKVAYTSAKLYDTNRQEMSDVLKEMRERREREGMLLPSNLTGFAFDEKDEIVMCLDLSTPIPIPIYGKAAIAAKYLPFHDLKEHGPAPY